jgi:hypothetical protein
MPNEPQPMPMPGDPIPDDFVVPGIDASTR